MSKPKSAPLPPLSLQYGDGGTLLAAVGAGTGRAFAEAHFPHAGDCMRIATAFFHLQGYERIRDLIPTETRILLMIGRGEGDRTQVGKAIETEIRDELGRVLPVNLVPTAREVLARLESGRFRIADARSLKRPFHCKFYISGPDRMWHGSANLSKRGLETQAEQAQAITDPSTIAEWAAWFDAALNTAEDLSSQVAEALRQWLNLDDPFDVYLAALHHLLRDRHIRREKGAHEPDYYQSRLAAWAVGELGRCRGVMLIVSTGLGKTTIGSEIAGLLRADDVIGHALVVAPHAVHRKWEDQLDGRYVPCKLFHNGLLFNEANDKAREVARLETALSKADARTLLIVDEAHLYRNQLLRHAESQKPMGRRPAPQPRALRRINEAVRRGAHIVLLTGSAYAASLHDLRTLVALLPPPSELDPAVSVSLFSDRWTIGEVPDVLKLPMVSVLSYPAVLSIATKRGDVERGKPFLVRKGMRRYLPTGFRSEVIAYRLTEENRMRRVIEAGRFAAEKRVPSRALKDDGSLDSFASEVYENDALAAWTACPWALHRVLQKNMDSPGPTEQPQLGLFDSQSPTQEPEADSGDSYKTPLRQPRSVRQQDLEDLLHRVDAAGETSDDKTKHLIRVLTHLREGLHPLKVIVYVDRHITALYLSQCLARELPAVRVVATVNGTRDDHRLLNHHNRLDILDRFAPIANHVPNRPLTSLDSPEVLICTNADSIGVDLEDATTVVNYDAPLTADVLVQRLGRILRPSPDRKRKLAVYTFIPALALKEKATGVAARLRERYVRLRDRHGADALLMGNGILPLDSRRTLQVSLRDVPIDAAALLGQLAPHSRPGWLVDHLAALEEHRSRAGELAQRMVHSAAYADLSADRIVVVFQHGDKIHSLIADAATGQAISTDWRDVLGAVACTPEQHRALFPDVTVEKVTDSATRAVRAWCQANDAAEESTQRLVELYLAREPS